MTFNLLDNSPCLEIDGKEWEKSVKIGTCYLVNNNNIIIVNNCDHKKQELFHLSLDLKFVNNFLKSKLFPNQISLNQVITPLTCQFKINQFKNDFHSIKSIGKGGFGRVYSAISNIDLHMYAIKKVKINCSKLNKKEIADALKEFRILAKLNHSNIVRYHTAWFEQINNTVRNNCFENSNHSSKPVSMSINKISSSIYNSSSLSKSFNSSSMSYLTNMTMSDNNESESNSSEKSVSMSNNSSSSNYSSTKNMTISEFNESESNSSEKSDFDSVSTENKENQDSVVFDYSSNGILDKLSIDSIDSKNEHQGILELYQGCDNNIHKFDFVLYIQMELCHHNLQDWLEIRNKQPGVLCDLDLKNTRSLANQLLKGVAYIHSNKIIHRDIKPANIFLTIHSTNRLQLKIGDFGLSKFFENDFNEEMGNAEKMKLTANTGTAFYSAPEVSNPEHKLTKYNHKCDLYSVGIILVELMCKFTTFSELVRVITNISNGITYNELMELWPLEAPHVCNLISVCPENRPEANFILNQPCCFKESFVQNGLYEHFKKIMSENYNLKNENETLRRSLENIRLSQKVCN